MGNHFLIVETIGSGKPTLLIVPYHWVSGNNLLCPPNHARELKRNVTSVPDTSWKKFSCNVKRKNFKSYSDAELELFKMMGQSKKSTSATSSSKANVQKNDFPGHEQKSLSTSSRQISHVLPSSIANVCTESSSKSKPSQPSSQKILPVTWKPDLKSTVSVNHRAGMTIPEFPNSDHQCLPPKSVLNIESELLRSAKTEIFEKIDSAKSEIIQSVTNAMNETMAKILARVKRDYDASLRTRSFQEVSDLGTAFRVHPIASATELQRFEQNLGDKNFAKKVFNYMKSVIGPNGDNCNGLNICYILIDRFFARKFMPFCSWSGRSHSGIEKCSIKKCENILNIFLKIVRSVNSHFSERQMEYFFKSITKNAKRRSEGTGLRQSSVHHRVKQPQHDVHFASSSGE